MASLIKTSSLIIKGSLLCSLLLFHNIALAQSTTAFTYQGRLHDGSTTYTGMAEFQATLWNAASNGITVGSSPPSLVVPVTNGLFVLPLDFGTAPFSAGANRWLQLEVRTTIGPFNTLSPRQPLTPTPYSIYAGNAATATIASNVASGAVVGTLNGLKDNVLLQAGANVTITSNGNTLTIASAGTGGTGIWTVNNNNATYNAGNVGIGTATPVHRLSLAGGPSWTDYQWSGALSLENGAAIGWGSNLSGKRFGMGHSTGGFYFFRTDSDPGTMGSPPLYDVMLSDDGNVGIGAYPTAGVRLEVSGTTLLKPGNGNISLSSPNGELGISLLPTASNSRADLRFDGGTVKLAAGAGTAPPIPEKGITINTNGNVGVGMGSPLPASQWKLEVNGPVRMTAGGSGGAVQISAPNGESGMGIIGVNRADLRFDGATLKLVAGAGTAPPSPASGIAITTAGDVGIGAATPGAKLHAETSQPSRAAVYGNATGLDGVGVYGQAASGAAIHAQGNASQARDKGGFVKAMAYIDPFLPANQYVVRCYNSQLSAASTSPCGITVERFDSGQYWIDFGFKVDDRFISVTPGYYGLSISAYSPPGFENVIRVFSVVSSSDGGGPVSSFADTSFFIFVY
jgi:hypothetical protein